MGVADDEKPPKSVIMGYPSSVYQHVPPALSPSYHHQDITSYHSPQNYDPMLPNETNGTNFLKILLILMTILVIGICILSLFLWMQIDYVLPVFQVTSLSLSSFDFVKSEILGTWDVNITILNKNSVEKIEFDLAKAAMLYHHHLIAVSPLQNLEVLAKEKIFVPLKLETLEPGKMKPLKNDALARFEQERQTGTVDFSLRFVLDTKFVGGKSSWNDLKLNVFCENLIVSISPTGEGTLAREAEECSIFA